MYQDRFYRNSFDTRRFHPVFIQAGESDIWVGWNSRGKNIDNDAVRGEGEKILTALRNTITEYDREHSGFIDILEPIIEDRNAPDIIRSMIRSTRAAGVGPMASVAGVLAEYLGRALDEQFHFDEIVVENGGDYWIKILSPLSIGVYAGLSSLSGTIGVVLNSENSPLGLACSSGTVGPSLSYGKADAALVTAGDAAAADAWATALGNRVKGKNDLEEALGWLIKDAGEKTPEECLKPLGALIILGDTIAAQGKITLGPVQK